MDGHCTLVRREGFSIPAELVMVPGRSMRRNGNSRHTATETGPTAAGDPTGEARLRDLMSRAQNGDRAAYDQLLRSSIPILQRMVRRHGIVPEHVEDVVQDILLTIHSARHTYDPGRPFLSWIAMIAHRRSMDALRTRYRRDGREVYSPVAYDGFAQPEDAGAEQIERDLAEVKEAMRSLPEAQKQALELLAFQQRSLQEASQQTGRTIVALKVNLHRALNALRKRIRSGADDD
jgi:RNA polymerase sigma factor (sigma-70 family)